MNVATKQDCIDTIVHHENGGSPILQRGANLVRDGRADLSVSLNKKTPAARILLTTSFNFFVKKSHRLLLYYKSI